MHQNSSISSFKKGIFLVLFIPFLTLLIGWGSQYWASKLGLDAHTYGTLVNHQLTKLENPEQVDTVFVGDSSLGNAVSSKTWEKLGYGSAYNLALMGHFGYSGLYHMAERTLEKIQPKNLIFMHIATLANYSLSYDTFGDLSLARSPLKAEYSIPEMIKSWMSAYFNIKTIRTNIKRIYRFYLEKPNKNVRHIRNDYTEQITRLDPTKTKEHATQNPDYMPSDIRTEHFVYLKKIQALCTQTNTNCLFIYGPIYEPVCPKMTKYIDALNGVYKELGLQLVNKAPVCFPDNDLGDTVNHVLPERKDTYTALYGKLLQPFLK